MKKIFQPLCLICRAKEQEYDNGADEEEMKIATLFEYDKTMVGIF